MVDSIRQQILDAIDIRFKAVVTAETYNSIRQLIINKINIRFKTILVTGGYKMNLGSNVFAWRKTPIQASELPALVYRDRTETKEKSAFKEDVRKLTIEVEIFAETADQIRECLADLETAIYTDETWNGLALNTDFETNEMEIEHKEDYFSASKILIYINYFTVGNNPYS